MELDPWLVIYLVVSTICLLILGWMLYAFVYRNTATCKEAFFEYLVAQNAAHETMKASDALKILEDTLALGTGTTLDYVAMQVRDPFQDLAILTIDPSVQACVYLAARPDINIGRVRTFQDLLQKTRTVMSPALRVGYDTPGAWYAMLVLCRCFDLDPSKFELVPIDRQKWRDEWMSKNIDAYVFEEQAVPAKIFDQLDDFDFEMIDYGDMNDEQIQKLMYFLPFVEWRGLDMRTLMPRRKNLVNAYRLLAFHKAYFVEHGMHIEALRTPLNTIMNDRHILAYHHHYARFPQLTFLSLEHFENSQQPIILEADSYVSGRVAEILGNGVYKRFETHEITINGVLLHVGDRIKLSKQTHDQENGEYTVTSVTGDGLVLETCLLMDFQNRFRILRKSGDWSIVTNLNPINGVWQLRVYFQDLDAIGYLITNPSPIDTAGTLGGPDKGFFIFKLYEGERKFPGQPEFSCIDKPLIKVKQACEAIGGLWDAPCSKDTECPFFSPNNKGYRGACVNGYCELPIGLKRAGYRKYILGQDSFPYCKGCNAINIEQCCLSQDEPDYAFPNLPKV